MASGITTTSALRRRQTTSDLPSAPYTVSKVSLQSAVQVKVTSSNSHHSLLYHTTVILAHRPFWAARGHYQACISAAHSIERLLLLLERTFSFANITYMMAYCVYTGASAILPDARD